MKYLCLIYDAEAVLNAMPQAEMQKMMGEYRAFGESLRQSGQHLGSNRLRPVESATTVRVRNGKVSTTDGPFAETKEQLGGYFLIEARDLNEAIQIAGRVPSARTGSVEVRPIWEVPADAS
ncbi:MAG TPA: YciI family protein [Gemmatimonadales bacterium]|nr:YciI family protein [Gemmatimonadales bacterium]